MTDATEMELRVARRIGSYYGLHGEKNVKNHIKVAQAAIRAMRDPGHDLTAAVVRPGDDRTEAVRMWQAMIDAASPMKIIVPTPFRLRPEKEIPPRRKALAKPK